MPDASNPERFTEQMIARRVPDVHLKHEVFGLLARPEREKADIQCRETFGTGRAEACARALYPGSLPGE